MPIIENLQRLEVDEPAEIRQMADKAIKQRYSFQAVTETTAKRGDHHDSTTFRLLHSPKAVLAEFYQIARRPSIAHSDGAVTTFCVALVNQHGSYTAFMSLDDYCPFYRANHGKTNRPSERRNSNRSKSAGDHGGLHGGLSEHKEYATEIRGGAAAEAYHLRTAGRV